MGTLKAFDLRRLIEEYQTSIFVETGTGAGDGLAYARTFPFTSIYSVEIVKHHAEKLQTLFQSDSRIKILSGNSYEALDIILNQIAKDARILFWLDAHYPGADLGFNDFNSESDISKRLPLERELSSIRKYRPECRDVILIDDLRIYEKGPYEAKDLTEIGLERIALYNQNFIADFEVGFNSERSYRDTGTLILTPKKS